MNLEFSLQGVPALSYQYEQCNPDQLDFLTQQTNLIIARLEDAKKSASIISTLMTRLNNQYFVRCTTQSVSITAAARYDPAASDMDLHFLDIAFFVGLVTYLPLPTIRTLVANPAATRRAATIWQNHSVDPRWTVYFSRLTFVNEQWAALFLKEVQSHIVSSDTSLPSSTQPSSLGSERVLLQTDGHNLPESEPQINNDRVDSSSSELLSSENEASVQPPPLSEDLLLRVIKAKSSAWGAEHPTTVESVLHLVTTYISQKEFTKAKTLLLQALRACEDSYAPDGPEVSRVKVLLTDVDCHLADQR